MVNRELPNSLPEIQSVPAQPAPDETTPAHLAEFRLNRRQRAIRATMHGLYRVAPAFAASVAAWFFARPRRRPLTYFAQLPEGAQPIDIFHNLRGLHGYAWGSGPKTVLLVHGWESHLGHMLPLVKPLVEAGFRVVAIDGPGHGQSPQMLTNMYDYGEAIRCALEQLEGVYAIVANSFGAAATTTMLARQPELQPEKLVLVSPMGHIHDHLRIFGALVGLHGQFAEDVREAVQDRLPVPMHTLDTARAAQSLTQPGLVIHDRHDPVIPFETGRRIADNWPAALFRETCFLGHKGILRDETIQADIVTYLDDNRTGLTYMQQLADTYAASTRR